MELIHLASLKHLFCTSKRPHRPEFILLLVTSGYRMMNLCREHGLSQLVLVHLSPPLQQGGMSRPVWIRATFHNWYNLCIYSYYIKHYTNWFSY